MQPENIDNEFLPSSTIGKPHTLQTYFALALLWIGIAYCIYAGFTLDAKMVITIVLLIISTATTYFKPKAGVLITLAILILGVLDLLMFLPYSHTISFGSRNFQLSISLIPLTVGIIHYVTNRKVLSRFIKKLLKPEVPKEDAEAIQRGKIEGFKKRYSKKSTAELKVMAENKSLLSEARKAARELLNEKQSRE